MEILQIKCNIKYNIEDSYLINVSYTWIKTNQMQNLIRFVQITFQIDFPIVCSILQPLFEPVRIHMEWREERRSSQAHARTRTRVTDLCRTVSVSDLLYSHNFHMITIFWSYGFNVSIKIIILPCTINKKNFVHFLLMLVTSRKRF